MTNNIIKNVTITIENLIFNTEFNKNKYYYHIKRYSTDEGIKYEDTKFKYIDFITIKEKNKGVIDCGSIMIDTRNKIISQKKNINIL